MKSAVLKAAVRSPDVRSLDMSRCRVALVVNGAAGKKDADQTQATVRHTVAPRVREFPVYTAARGSSLAETARQAVSEGAAIVLALGGDGTQSAVAGALAGGSAVMGVLPGGTFNHFARDPGVGETLESALETVLTGRVHHLDVGEVNGRIFLNNASFGVYPQIPERREAIYRRWGRRRTAAYWSVLVTLWDMRSPMTLTVTLHNQTRQVRTPLAFAARSAFPLESLGLDGADAIRAGRFALFLAKGQRPRDLVAAAFRLAFGRVHAGRDFEMLITNDIDIDTRQPVRLLAFDGEKQRMNSPFRLRVHPEALAAFVSGPDPDPVLVPDPGPDPGRELHLTRSCRRFVDPPDPYHRPAFRPAPAVTG